MTVRAGSGSAMISGAETTPGGFGTMSQKLDAEPLWAQRLRYSAWVKTEDVVLEEVGDDVETTSMLPEGGMIMEEQ